MSGNTATAIDQPWRNVVLLSFIAQVITTAVTAHTMRPSLASVAVVLAAGAVAPAIFLRGVWQVCLTCVLPFALAIPAMLSAELLAHALGGCLQ